MQVWSNFQKSITVILHINIIRKQNLHEHRNRYRKEFDKIQHSFMIKNKTKNTQQTRNRRELHQYYRVPTTTPTVNIICNCERLIAVPLREGTRQGCLLFLLLFNMC